ncbi:hypothetical protein ABTI66_13885, partial [Acinetobacter baumannii]
YEGWRSTSWAARLMSDYFLIERNK